MVHSGTALNEPRLPRLQDGRTAALATTRSDLVAIDRAVAPERRGSRVAVAGAKARPLDPKRDSVAHVDLYSSRPSNLLLLQLSKSPDGSTTGPSRQIRFRLRRLGQPRLEVSGNPGSPSTRCDRRLRTANSDSQRPICLQYSRLDVMILATQEAQDV